MRPKNITFYNNRFDVPLNKLDLSSTNNIKCDFNTLTISMLSQPIFALNNKHDSHSAIFASGFQT